MRIIILCITMFLAASCARKIPADMLDMLQRQFMGQAMESGWKFVKVTHGFGGRELVVDILVTQPMKGTLEAQHELLKNKVCPPVNGNDEFWNKMQDYKLSIAAYTQDRKFTVLVDCENPLRPSGGSVR